MGERKNVKMTMEEEMILYERYLKEEERSRAMVEKYLRDVRKFLGYVKELGGGEFDKELILEYKQYLNENYRTASVDSTLAAVNSSFEYLGCEECKVKLFKTQRVQFSEKERELTEKDYERLVHMAERKGGIRMSTLLQTIGSAGVRVSELRFITVEALETGWAEIHNKGKSRVALLSVESAKVLKRCCRKVGIVSESIFITRNGKLIDRSNISKRMKVLGKEAGVDTMKVFPHNFRRLFARVFYSIEKDVVRLMDLLGHSNISTTRTYTMSMEEQLRWQMSQMRMVLNQLETAIRRKK